MTCEKWDQKVAKDRVQSGLHSFTRRRDAVSIQPATGPRHGGKQHVRRYLPPFRVAITMAIVLAILLTPKMPPLHVMAAAGPRENPSTLTPYTGMSVTTWTTRPELAPPSAARDLGTTSITSTWEIQDATHYRVDSIVDGSALDSNQNTVVANGTDVIWYSRMDNRAIRMPVNQSVLGTFDLFQGLTALPPGTTLEQYLALYNSKARGTHARYVGEGHILGRVTDIIDVAPVYRVNNKNSTSCNSAKACLRQSHGVGRTRLWIDHQYAVVLRSQEFGVPATSGFERRLLYRVTRITFGQGPNPDQLAYTPPGQIVKPPKNSETKSSNSKTEGGTWQLPPPFLPVTNLKGPDSRKYLLIGVGESGDPMLGGRAMEEALFAPGGGGVSPGGPYVYIEERIRADGVPQNLRTGQQIQLGSCEAWEGTYPDGLNRLVLSRRSVAILLVSNSLSTGDLQQYAGIRLCQ